MITLLTGDNSFELNRALELLAQHYDSEITRVDGEDVSLDKLIEYASAVSLFAAARMIIIRDLSMNKPVWIALGERLNMIGDDVHLVLVEPSVDKRTATYKRLQKSADVKIFAAWTDRDTAKAEMWIAEQAKQLGVQMDKKSIQSLMHRVGLDQWALYHALEKLAVLGAVDTVVIEQVIEAQPNEHVFNLLDAALNGNSRRVSEMIRTLQRSQDPYMTFGLLSSQVFQLVALSVSDKPASELASAIGAHPYALGKLAPYARKLGRSGTKAMVKTFASTDSLMKSTATDPWILIEQALVKTAIDK